MMVHEPKVIAFDDAVKIQLASGLGRNLASVKSLEVFGFADGGSAGCFRYTEASYQF